MELLVLNSPDNIDELDIITGLKPRNNIDITRRSEVTACDDCPRAGLFRYVYGLRTFRRKQGLDQSSYAHLTVALLLRGMDKFEVMRIIDNIMQDVAKDSGDPTDQDRVQDANMGFAVGCYVHDKLADFVEKRGWEIFNIEKKLEDVLHVKYESKQFKLPFRFQIDFAIRDDKGNIYVCDEKVIGTSPSVYARGLGMSLQTHAYLLWARQVLGPKVKSIIYFICAKPSVSRKGLTKGMEQSVDDYLLEVAENLEGVGRWAKIADKRKTNPSIQVQEFSPSKRMMDITIKRLLDHHALKSGGRNHLNYLPHDSCVSLWGVCDYLQICELDDKLWSQEINKKRSPFTTNPDPLDSERLHGASIKPVTTQTVKIKRIFGIPDKVKRKRSSLLTSKYVKVKD